MIEAFNLTKQFGELRAVDDVSFTAKEGEVFGIVGPNGAGKSTLIKILSTILTPTSGRAIINGLDMAKEPQKVRSIIGYLPEEPRVYDYMSGEEFLNFFSDMYKGDKKRIPELLEFVGLEKHAKRKISDYSKGMKHRISLARALIHDPPVLLLDEPTMGLDPASSRDIREKIKEMRREGKTILICTHYMDEADFLCNVLAIMNNGKFAASGKPEELKARLAKNRLLSVVIRENELTRKIADELDSEVDGRSIIVKTTDVSAALSKIHSTAKKFGANVLSIKTLDPSLEDVFVAVTRGQKWK